MHSMACWGLSSSFQPVGVTRERWQAEQSDNTGEEIDKSNLFIRGNSEDDPLVYVSEGLLLSSLAIRQHIAHGTSRQSGCSLRNKLVCTKSLLREHVDPNPQLTVTRTVAEIIVFPTQKYWLHMHSAAYWESQRKAVIGIRRSWS